MNSVRLNQIFENAALASEIEINEIKQLTVEYPYYALPYVVLSKIYYQKEHYRFDEILHHAAIRVKDREWLYHYIRSENKLNLIEEPVEIVNPDLQINEIPEILIHQDTDSSHQKKTLNDFLNEEPLILAEPIIDESVIENETILLETTEVENNDEELILTPIELEIVETTNTETDTSIETNQEEEEPENETAVDDSVIELPKEEEIKENNLIEKEPLDYAELNALRKHPVYNVEAFLKADVAEHNAQEVNDFFSWLKKPQVADIINSEEIIEVEKDPEKESIIDRFISINPQISRPKKEFYNAENMAKRSEAFDFDFVTETLANIYYEQGNTEMAIKAYEKLSLQNPTKKAYFASLIQKIKKEK